jgi:hypothetical protein
VLQRRGAITVLNHEQLAAGACECHRVITGEFSKVVGGALGTLPIAGPSMAGRGPGNVRVFPVASAARIVANTGAGDGDRND